MRIRPDTDLIWRSRIFSSAALSFANVLRKVLPNSVVTKNNLKQEVGSKSGCWKLKYGSIQNLLYKVNFIILIFNFLYLVSGVTWPTSATTSSSPPSTARTRRWTRSLQPFLCLTSTKPVVHTLPRGRFDFVTCARRRFLYNLKKKRKNSRWYQFLF